MVFSNQPDFSPGCRAYLETISTLGASQHLDVATGSLDEIQDDARRCGSVAVTVVPADVRLVRGRNPLSVTFDASGQV